ncbi:zinc ribbon domain-containing protein [Alloacidobacterium dinghuense]|uniref:Zinc ribbon domain-containing protein n=1 Tax=Alloacidobacterium dinghuense TaxID=2763107 RepID=A0A7G8BH80_9BACT|nr:zinc ribbon domain-containing protein [Alloacidobacterium dinghuense]QNI31900.1 zinc ribbon domain-containing protein [Alloacidobacterium dinghuense]
MSCHRCGTTLATPEIFCPHCGAPQLRFEPSDEQQPYQAQGNGSTRAGNQLIAWRPAVQAALIVALPVGILSSLFDFGILWVLAGGFCAIALYQRKAAPILSPGAGWRIGMLVGMLAAFLSTLVDGLSMVVERYGLHHGASIDQKLIALTQQMTDQMVHQNPEAAQQIPWFIHFWLSPDGHAAVVLFMSSFAAIMMIAFSSIGGVLGARVLGARKRVSLHS